MTKTWSVGYSPLRQILLSNHPNHDQNMECCSPLRQILLSNHPNHDQNMECCSPLRQILLSNPSITTKTCRFAPPYV